MLGNATLTNNTAWQSSEAPVRTARTLNTVEFEAFNALNREGVPNFDRLFVRDYSI